MKAMWLRSTNVACFWIALFAFVLGAIPCCAESKAASKQSQGRPAEQQLAPTPPMGWNSWDSYGLRINEQQFRDNVDVLAATLRRSGYTYAVIDEGWYLYNPEDRPHPELLRYAIDANGRYLPVSSRFPSARQVGQNIGFRKLADWVHSKGLKFGIHIVRGIPRESVRRNLPIAGSTYTAEDAADQSDACSWDPTNWGVKDTPAGQAWYDALIRQYASWGIDFVKVDCIASHPYKVSEIRQIQLAIKRSGHPIVLSLSPGPTALAHAEEVGSLAQMWRISNDVWDVWESKGFPAGVKNQFENAAHWAKYAHPGNWPDADMLPLGELRPFPDVGPGPRHTRLTPAEQRTQLGLWAFARSPLIIGANLTLLDDATLGLLTNPDLVRIDQTAVSSRQVLHDGDTIVWTADLADAAYAVGVFNTGNSAVHFRKDFAGLGLPSERFTVRDAWNSSKRYKASSLDVKIEPHDALVLILKAK